jgi:prepilin-type N-terminal cleavage/methylation domain-containing protein
MRLTDIKDKINSKINKMCKHVRNQAGFTLLELLIVVAILAIVSGGVLVAYDGLETKSAQGAASHAMAATDSSIRAIVSLNRTAPNSLDSLIAGTPADGTQSVAAIPAGAVVIGNLPSKLVGKITVSTAMTAAQTTALTKAGITQLRYVDLAGNDSTCAPTCTLTTGQAGATSTPAVVGTLASIDIPNRIFDIPREGSGKNRGRGYSHTLVAAGGSPVMTWSAGAGGINNTKLGAAADDVLIAFGLGNNASIFRPATGPSSVSLAQAPNYGNTAKHEYNRFVLLYNIGPAAAPFGKAKLQAVVDTFGDFVDEELAEFSGQKF